MINVVSVKIVVVLKGKHPESDSINTTSFEHTINDYTDPLKSLLNNAKPT